MVGLFGCSSDSGEDIDELIYKDESKLDEDTFENDFNRFQEQMLFDNIIDGISNSGFYNPSKIRLLGAGRVIAIPTTNSHAINNPIEIGGGIVGDGTGIVLHIQGDNRLGGTLNKHFLLVMRSELTDYEELNMYEVERDFDATLNERTSWADFEIDIGRINNGIRAHYEKLGID